MTNYSFPMRRNMSFCANLPDECDASGNGLAPEDVALRRHEQRPVDPERGAHGLVNDHERPDRAHGRGEARALDLAQGREGGAATATRLRAPVKKRGGGSIRTRATAVLAARSRLLGFGSVRQT